MILRPKTLTVSIVASFVLMLMTISEAHNPETQTGVLFWLSFAVFAFCCVHLSKNDKYYSEYLDDEL